MAVQRADIGSPEARNDDCRFQKAAAVTIRQDQRTAEIF